MAPYGDYLVFARPDSERAAESREIDGWQVDDIGSLELLKKLLGFNQLVLVRVQS